MKDFLKAYTRRVELGFAAAKVNLFSEYQLARVLAVRIAMEDVACSPDAALTALWRDIPDDPLAALGIGRADNPRSVDTIERNMSWSPALAQASKS